MRNYEGTYTQGGQPSDQTVAVTAATNAASAVLTATENGAFVGMTVSPTAATGGTWASIVGNSYTVTAVSTDTITINLNSTSLGTLSSMTLDYTGSSNYLSYFRGQSYLSPQLGTLETLLYTNIASTSGSCSPAACSINPSQFNLASAYIGTNATTGTWLTWSFDVFGYFTVANCSACTISGSALTLGGTVTGIFGSGQTVLWGPSNPPTITGACSKTGSGPAGSSVGDVCPLSALFTVSTGTAMSGNATPSATSNPVTSWKAICTWNTSSFAGGC